MQAWLSRESVFSLLPFDMKRAWIPVTVFTGLGLLSALAWGAVSIANKVDYEVLSYQVQMLDSEGVTFRVMFGITNPSGFDLEVWDQHYEVFVAGFKISDITSSARYRLIAQNTSVIPLDVRLRWDDINQKIAPIASQSSVTEINNLPVLIKGKISAKSGVLKITKLPVRTTMKLGDFLP